MVSFTAGVGSEPTVGHGLPHEITAISIVPMSGLEDGRWLPEYRPAVSRISPSRPAYLKTQSRAVTIASSCPAKEDAVSRRGPRNTAESAHPDAWRGTWQAVCSTNIEVECIPSSPFSRSKKIGASGVHHLSL